MAIEDYFPNALKLSEEVKTRKQSLYLESSENLTKIRQKSESTQEEGPVEKFRARSGTDISNSLLSSRLKYRRLLSLTADKTPSTELTDTLDDIKEVINHGYSTSTLATSALDVYKSTDKLAFIDKEVDHTSTEAIKSDKLGLSSTSLHKKMSIYLDALNIEDNSDLADPNANKVDNLDELDININNTDNTNMDDNTDESKMVANTDESNMVANTDESNMVANTDESNMVANTDQADINSNDLNMDVSSGGIDTDYEDCVSRKVSSVSVANCQHGDEPSRMTASSFYKMF